MDQQHLKAASTPKRRVTRTRDALCSGLLSLLEESPFEQITVKEITARANVGYATFFRRYTDKEQLLHDLAAQEIRRLLTMTIPILFSVDSQASTQALCAYVWEHRKLWRALLTGGAANILKEEYLNQALEMTKDNLPPDAKIPYDLAVTFAVTGGIEILTWWLKQENPLSVKQVSEYFNRLAIEPLFR
jgi:AcrR family transcriptional regulator